MLRNEHRFIWIGLGVLTLIIRMIFGFFPVLAEKLYSRGLFLGIRWVFDHTLGLLPIPAVYVVGGLFVGGVTAFFIRRLWLPRLQRTWKEKLKSMGLSTLAWGGAFTFLFYFLWGFHYFRVPLEEQMGLDARPLTLDELKADAEMAAATSVSFRQALPGDQKDSVWANGLPPDYEKLLRTYMEEVLGDYGYPKIGRVRVRKVQPIGALIRLGISGIYIPFAGEGCVEPGLPPLDLAFTTAHEMAHGYGFADEGSANFIAFLTCQRADHPFLRYAGTLTWYRYVSREYFVHDPEGFQALRDSLPQEMRADLRVIRRYYQQRQSWVTDATSKINDSYLKSQGVKEGAASYDRMVQLVGAWRRKGITALGSRSHAFAAPKP